MIPGFVLAGGASRRMGRDKALLPLRGEPLAARAARILSEAGCAPVTLIGNQPGLTMLGWPVLREQDGDHHPLRGVAAGLSSTNADLVLFSPCDLSALTAAAVRILHAHGAPCWVAGQPLLCVLSAGWAESAARQAAVGGSVRDFVAALPSIPLPEEVLVNLNRPEQLPRRR